MTRGVKCPLTQSAEPVAEFVKLVNNVPEDVAGAAVGAFGIGYAVGTGINYLFGEQIQNAVDAVFGPPGGNEEICQTRPCPPCVPAVGTIGYRIDVVPPSRPHWPFPGTHVHLYRMNQNSNNCQCFWQSTGVTAPPPPPGAVPM
jgi:hypothetical protein